MSISWSTKNDRYISPRKIDYAAYRTAVASSRRADYIAGIRAGRYMETDSDIMGKKRKGNKWRITDSREKERARENETRKEMKQKREAIKME